MRVERVNNKYLLCGVILPLSKIQEGQEWAPASGAKGTVKIILKDGEWITYSGELQPAHSKLHYAFQCRYCLVLPSNEIPEEFKEVTA